MASGQILVIAAIVIYILAKRFAGSPVGAKTLVLPLVMVGYGLTQLSRAADHPLTIALLAIEGVISLAAGAARAATIKLYVRDGHLWQRYRLTTLMVWLAMIAIRIGFLVAGGAAGVSLPEGGTIFFTFGLSMIVETALVGKRAAATGAPIMARQSRRPSVNARY